VVAHRFVDVGPMGGEHEAGRQGGGLAAASGDNDAVGRDVQRHGVGGAEGGRVGPRGVDRCHEALDSALDGGGGDRSAQQLGVIGRGLPVQRA
jgi:hypothetical protein